MSNRLFRSDSFFSSSVSADLYVVLKRFGAILWPETAFTGPLSILMREVASSYEIRSGIWAQYWPGVNSNEKGHGGSRD